MREALVENKDIVLMSTADWDNPFWTNKPSLLACMGRETRSAQRKGNGRSERHIDSMVAHGWACAGETSLEMIEFMGEQSFAEL